MTILITGANGFLGQYLCTSLANKGFKVIATSRGICKLFNIKGIKYQCVDVTKKEDVVAILATEKPDIVIHNAAMSKPDICNTNQAECILQNVTATSYILDGCKLINPYFIYISTDFVFGEDGPHDETVMPAPLNFYGQSKLMAEQLVLASSLQVAIVRPIFIYGKVLAHMTPTFLHWVKTNLDNKKPMKIVNDQQRTPTYVKDICEGIFLMITKKVTGIFHLAGKDILTPYTMATQLANLLYLDVRLIEPVMSATFAEPVQRAKKSGLKIDKAIKILGYNPVNFEEGVRLSFLNK